MKLIIAYIRPECLNSVKQALYAQKIYNMSVTNVLGSGRQKGFTETYRGVIMEVNLLKKIRLEIGQRRVRGTGHGSHQDRRADR